ncbi:Bax inhibitor-1/YccA family protein [Ligilactobacillus sp. LYQ135]
MNNFDQPTSLNSQGLNKFLSKMYAYMAGAIAVSAIMALITVRYLRYTVIASPVTMIILGVISIAMVFSLSFKPDRAPGVSIAMLFIYAAIEGVFLSSILIVYAAESITMAFVSAAVVFVVLSIFGLNTKKDLSRIGRQAVAALFAFFIVSIINLFLQSPAIQYVFSYIGVIIFTILTAYDTQQMKTIYVKYGDQVNTTNLAVNGALQLYLDFINMFIYLLQIFGHNDNN